MDAYCKQCGYIVNERVTFSECCDSCGTPIQWHGEEEVASIPLKVLFDLMEAIRVKLTFGDSISEEEKELFNNHLERTQAHFKEMNQYWQDEKIIQ